MNSTFVQVAAEEPQRWEAMAGWAWVDLVGFGVVILLAALGIWRGLWWQVVRLVGLVGAVAVARIAGPRWMPRVQSLWPDIDAAVAGGIAWALAFVLALVIVAVLGFLGRKLLQAMQLDLVDRAGGLVAGVVTGLVLHISLLAATCQLATQDWSKQLLAKSYSERLLHTFGHRWPVVLAKEAGHNLDDLWRQAEANGAPTAPGRDTPAGHSGGLEAPGDPVAEPPAEPMPEPPEPTPMRDGQGLGRKVR